MTEITATYVSASSFTVSGSKLDEFSPGRAVWANCGTDGVKYAFVKSASYSSPDTTVTLDTVESQSITSNLASVLFGRIKYGNTKGNEPLQNLWAMRGHKRGLGLSFKESNNIYIKAGSLHINDGTSENIYAAQSMITKACSVTGTQYYAIYVDPPDSGLVLAAADIEVSTTMPTYDQAKCGWYHPTTTDWRCIGFVPVVSGSVHYFKTSGRRYYLAGSFSDCYAQTPSNNWMKVTFSVPGVEGTAAVCACMYGYSNYAGYFTWRLTGISGAQTRVGFVDSSLNWATTSQMIYVDANRQAEIAWDGACTNQVVIYTTGFELPDGF